MISRDALSKARNDTLDLFRVISAGGVIWFHVEGSPYKRLGLAGLVFFLIISVVLQLSSARRGSLREYLRNRSERLLVPWVAWFLIYGLLNIGVGKTFLPPMTTLVQGILSGPWIGLWFLPFSFLSAILVFWFIQPLSKLRLPIQLATCATISVLVLFIVCLTRTTHNLDAPWAQWLQAVPSIPIGMTMALARKNTNRMAQILIIFEGLLVVICIILYHVDQGEAISFGVGTFLVTVGLLLPSHLPKIVEHISALCLGVYLVHGVVLSGFKALAGATISYWSLFFLTTFTSFLAIAIARQFRFLRKII